MAASQSSSQRTSQRFSTAFTENYEMNSKNGIRMSELPHGLNEKFSDDFAESPKTAYKHHNFPESPKTSYKNNFLDSPIDPNDDDPTNDDEYVRRRSKSTSDDARDMQRMGHKQQLTRHFRLLSTISFVAIATANWELTIFSVNQGLTDGGRAGLIWSYVWNFFGFLPIIMSMAEMASMAPIAGAQYHWVSEFAPPRFQKALSYFTGWFSTLAWQAGNAQGLFLTGTLIQTLIYLNNDTYNIQRYQGSLLVIATVIVVLAINIYGNRFLPHFQNVLLVLHTLLFLCLLMSVAILPPHTTAKVVFTEFSNFGGWPNIEISVLAGQLSAISAMTGVDTAAHMSEEVKDAGRNVPIAMMSAYFINAIFSIPIIILLCFAMPDLSAALEDPTGYPAIHVLRQTMSLGWTTAFLTATIVILYFSNVSYMAAVSRDLFAFARDFGTPFPGWTSKVDQKRRLPGNALIVSAIVASLLSLIYIGNDTAYYAITSLFVVSILQCYMFSVGSVLWRRIYHPETLPPARWSLGRWGIPINILALVYVVWAFFWSFWPQFYKPSASELNWASVVFGAVLVLSAVWYVIRARYVYRGPVVLVEGRGRVGSLF